MTRRWLTALLAEAGRVELRHLPSGRSIVVDDVDVAQAQAGSWGHAGNVYATLNRPRTEIVAGSTKALCNDDMQTVVLLPFDFDPVRPTGVASTYGELMAAVEARDSFVRAMLSRGWPLPAVGMSGNGTHAIYRVFLPCNSETRELVRTVYTGLSRRFSTDEVTFDPVVHNPGRIWRLYGAVNRKGIPTGERPHRLATVALPADWRRLPAREVERLASEFARHHEHHHRQAVERGRVTGSGDFTTLDVVTWFAAHGLYLRHLTRNVHEVVCPWEGDHTSSGPGDTVIYAGDGRGWPGFFCHHSHCAGRQVADVMALWGDADGFCGRAWRAA